QGVDHISSEDPRITRLNGKFYMVYCGFTMPSWDDKRINVCMAQSEDLVNWQKMRAVTGEVNGPPNKDGVLFPEKINGKFYLLHRPMVGQLWDYSMELAASDSVDGPWTNCGKLMQTVPSEDCRESWIGAGAVPIKLSKNRFLLLYHVAKRYENQNRDYFIDAAIVDFDQLRGDDWSSIVEKRLEHIMVPETRFEKNAPDDPDHELNVLFPCGSFELGEDIHIIYGGANTYVLAGKINKQQLLKSIEQDGFENPEIRPVTQEDLDRPVVI
ncbi:family 43 glycosylhydrolase, partial [Pirellulales bacterium]|nr:family 43 glycosylhydrolase [Pirellulales bacterium]